MYYIVRQSDDARNDNVVDKHIVSYRVLLLLDYMEDMRHGDAFRSWIAHYRALFSVQEIERSITLQWSFGAILFFFYATFSSWIGSTLITIETARRGAEVCWPYFLQCGDWYFLHALPQGYSQSIFYMCIYAMLLYSVFAIWRRQWVVAHVLMSLMLWWKLYVVFVLSYLIAGPYDYFHIAFTFVLLYVPHKEFFLKVVFALLYFLSATTKFDDTWVLGTYFSTLQTGLPIFPNALIPLFTNLVIGMQVVGAWFLLSGTKVLQRGALVFFITFHLYSGILVYYHYPSVSLPLLLILFGPLYVHSHLEVRRSSIPGWLLVGILIAFQLPPFLISGDRRITLEGNRYGMFMFEANHQCVATIRTYSRDFGTIKASYTLGGDCIGQRCLKYKKTYAEGGLRVEESQYETAASWNRCDPYVEWSYAQGQCKRNVAIQRIALTFDHSINGSPFYRIVDVPDMCTLAYKPFAHNDWIQLPPQAPIVGYPIKDEYRY